MNRKYTQENSHMYETVEVIDTVDPNTATTRVLSTTTTTRKGQGQPPAKGAGAISTITKGQGQPPPPPNKVQTVVAFFFVSPSMVEHAGAAKRRRERRLRQWLRHEWMSVAMIPGGRTAEGGSHCRLRGCRGSPPRAAGPGWWRHPGLQFLLAQSLLEGQNEEEEPAAKKEAGDEGEGGGAEDAPDRRHDR